MNTTATLNDDEARQRIGPWHKQGQPDLDAFTPETNFVVRAAAGSGKTTALVARMVALVRQGVPIEDLAAITFTRKVAGEMNERLYRELRRARSELAVQGKNDATIQKALSGLPRCFIGTIHAFCARILRSYPLAAGLPPRFQAGIDERDEQELRARALEAYLRSVYQERPEELAALTDLGVEPDDLGPFFRHLCRFPDLEPYTDGPSDVPAMDAAFEEAKALLKTWQPRRPNPLPKGRDDVMKAFDRAEKLLAYDRVETPAEKAAFLGCFAGVVKDGKAEVTLSAWGERGSPEYERAYVLRDEALPHLVDHVAGPKLRRWSAFVHEKVTDFLWPAVAQYQRERRDRGLLTHSDLLYVTRDLLRDHPTVRRRVQERYPRILVDEFQDTDPLQAEILFYLAGDDPEETSWRACTPRPGSLFIVGDDKQSIYRFRRADKEVFDEVTRLVAESEHGNVVDLNRNFRSLGTICTWCNDAFAALFSAPEWEDVQARYVPFEADRPEGADTCGLRRIDIKKVSYNRGADIAEKDAVRIADFIGAACDGEHPDLEGEAGAVFEEEATFSDFLILTHTKKRLNVYVDALAARGIPFIVTGSEDLGDAREVRALTQLLRCALRPDDPVAAVAYLRGGVCGFSDAELFAFKQAGGRFDQMTAGLAEETLEGLPDDLAARFSAAFGRIERARERLTTTRPTLAIEEIAGQAGLVAGAVHPEFPEEASLRGGQMLRALTYVRHLSGQGMDWGEIVEELQRVARGDEAVDGMTLETGRGEAVRVMNVHQAKGLEAPVVFLADPYSSGSGGHKPQLHVRREAGEVAIPVVEGEGHYQTISHAPLNWHPESDGAFQAEEMRHQEAEGHRLLYVAATRAKNMLVVSTYAAKEGGGYWGSLHSALERAEVPVLASSSSDCGEPRPVPAPGIDRQTGERSRQVRRLSQPSYQVATVTRGKGAPKNGGQSRGGGLSAGEGYGEDFGTAVHALFELLVCERAESLGGVPVRALLERHLEEPTGEEVARAKRMAEGLLASDLWSEVLSAKRVYAEYPVVLAASGATDEPANGAGFEPPLKVQRGTIDLVYQTVGGEWCIVDFKTDRLIENPFGNRTPKISEDHPYVRQVQAYASAWAQVAGKEAAQRSLWFADADEYVKVAGALQTYEAESDSLSLS